MKRKMKDGSSSGVKPITALSMYKERQRQQTFNLLLLSNDSNNNNNNSNDMIMTELRNHSFGGIIEISGEAGSGKTQLCLSICVSYASTPYYNDTKKFQKENIMVDHSSSSNNNNNNKSIENPILSKITPSKIENPYKKKLPGSRSPPKNPYSSQKQPKEDTNFVKNNFVRNNKTVLNSDNELHQTIHNDNNRSHSDLFQESYNSIYVSMGEGTTQQQIGQRLHQMVTERYPNNDKKCASILKRIITKKINNEDEVMDFLFYELPNRLLSSKNKVGLLVLDSIAGIYQCQEDAIQNNNYYIQRSTQFFQIATQLKKLSLQHNLHILVVNHVTYSIANETIIPSLGLSWSNCINTRYLLSRNQKLNNSKALNNPTIRTVQVIKSSHLTSKQISYFQIEKSGCRHVSINHDVATTDN